MEKEKTQMVLVPERWLQTLLADARKLDEAHKSWEYGNTKNDSILFKAVALMGYARSAEWLLRDNERVER